MMSMRFVEFRHRRCAPAAILIVALAMSACAQGKITEDPNAPGKPAALEEEQSADERLAQKITYEARKKAVADILADLTRLSGVSLRAGTNNQDWQVRDRKMNVFAKGVPLARLMSSIARVMVFKWSKSDDKDPPSYRLFMNRKTLLDADARIQQEDAAKKQRELEKRQKAWEQFTKCANSTPDDLARLKQENPFLYICASSGLAGSLSAFMKDSPAVAQALMSGQRLATNAASLSPAGQQALVAAMGDLRRLESRFGGRERPLPEGMAGNPGSISIDVNPHLDEMRGFGGDAMMLGEMRMQYTAPDGSQENVHLPLIDPDSAMAKMIGKVLVRSEEEDRRPEEIAMESRSEMEQALTSAMKSSDVGEPAPEHPDDPDLARKVKLEGNSRELDEALAALAKASELAVVSDSFGRLTFGRAGDYKTEGDLKSVLESIGDAFRHNWEKHDTLIEFRDKEWYRKLAALVPEAWLDEWRSKLKKNQTLDIDDLAKMAALTSEQFTMNIVGDDLLGRCMGAVFPAREPLRIYAVLDETQRQMMFAESGLDLRAVSPDQWTTVEKCISSRNSAFLQSLDARLTLFGSRAPDGKGYHYNFRLTSSELAPEITWSLTTPRYDPPPAEKNDDAKGKPPVKDAGAAK